MGISNGMAAVAFSVVASGCALDVDPTIGAANDGTANTRELGRRVTAYGISIMSRSRIQEACSEIRCFDVRSDHAILSVAVEAGSCPGARVDARLYRATPDGDYVRVGTAPAADTTDPRCETVPPGAVGWTGLEGNRYVVCVEYDGVASTGELTVHASTAAACATGETLGGDCTPCDEGGDDAPAQ